MTPGTAFVLIGFGIGALVVAGRAAPRGVANARGSADDLRGRAIEAQARAAIAAREARDLAARWSAAAARREI